MNATSVRPLNQMAQEGDQEALIWVVTMEMIVVVAEEAMIGVATEAEAGRWRKPGVVMSWQGKGKWPQGQLLPE